MAVLAPDASAVVEPLAVVQEGEVAGLAARVPLDCVDLWGAKRGETLHPCMKQQRLASLGLKGPEVVTANCGELKYLICFLSDLYNQTKGENRA